MADLLPFPTAKHKKHVSHTVFNNNNYVNLAHLCLGFKKTPRTFVPCHILVLSAGALQFSRVLMEALLVAACAEPEDVIMRSGEEMWQLSVLSLVTRTTSQPMDTQDKILHLQKYEMSQSMIATQLVEKRLNVRTIIRNLRINA